MLTEKERKEFRQALTSAQLEIDSWFVHDYDFTFVKSKLYPWQLNLTTKRKLHMQTLRQIALEHDLRVTGFDVNYKNVRKYTYFLVKEVI